MFDRRPIPARRTGTAPAPDKLVADPAIAPMPKDAEVPRAVFGVGEIVRHRMFPFRGVIYDVDPEFQNTDEWWEAIPEAIRPRKDQPFYHLLAENGEAAYVAYVSQQNLERDTSGEPVGHPAAKTLFEAFEGERYVLRREYRH